MGRFLNIVAFSFIALNCFAADNALTNDAPTAQNERLYQHFVKEMQKSASTNLDFSPTNAEAQAALRRVFESTIVDPSFGLKWDEVPGPTLKGSNAMSPVNAFVATNGWNMQTNDCVFDCIFANDKPKPIRGLPWAAIHDQEFPAVTHDKILYVFFRGFHHDGRGVAYNPHTNHFAASIDVFKPIGEHWYVWAFDHECPSSVQQPRIYEGAKPPKDLAPASK